MQQSHVRGLRAALVFGLTLACSALLAVSSIAAPQDESATVRDFRKLFRRFEEPADRVEAVFGLKGIEEGEVVAALLPVLKDDDAEVVRAAVEVLGGFETDPPRAELRAALVSAKRAEERDGLLRAWALGGYPMDPEDKELGRTLRKLSGDRQWQVRLRVAQAIAAGHPQAFEMLEEEVVDKEPAVRAGVLEALANLNDERVIDLAIAALDDEAWQVCSAAAGALGQVRHKRSIQPLMDRLDPELGRLLADYTTALERITGRRFGLDIEAWRRFWSNFADRFEIPTAEELEAKRLAAEESAKRYAPGTTYHGIETPSRAILFVVDVSGSMENWIMERERYEEGRYPSWSRMDIVSTELAETIRGLDANVNFNVLAFASGLKPWRKKLMPANALQKEAAAEWVLGLEPIGGASAREAAEGGVAGPVDLSAGKTNTYGALMYALGVLDEKQRVVGADDYRVEVDTVFFLTDGDPTEGRYIDPNDILREVDAANSVRRVVIHVTAVGQINKVFLAELAKQNGGQFVDLGR